MLDFAPSCIQARTRDYGAQRLDRLVLAARLFFFFDLFDFFDPLYRSIDSQTLTPQVSHSQPVHFPFNLARARHDSSLSVHCPGCPMHPRPRLIHFRPGTFPLLIVFFQFYFIAFVLY